MINANFVLPFLLAANVLFLLVVITALQRIDARCRRLEEFKLSVLAKPEGNPPVIDHTAHLAVLRKLEQRFASVQQSVESASAGAAAESRQVTPNLPIENAVRMAKQGASIDDLTRNCGLNIGEARLMQKLHGRAQLAAAGG
jgi:hypothetical protein